MKNRFTKGFTLIELLTVIAIIGILAAILIPTVGAAKTSAKKAKTRVQFNQWATAMGLFKQEYGYYPTIAAGNKVNPDKFAGALTGRNLAGTKYGSTTDANLCGNSKILSFYSIADSELSKDQTQLVDAFGNTYIVVFTDTNGDGIINATDGLTAAPVTAIDGTVLTPTNKSDGSSGTMDVSNGIRAGAIFYSAGKGTTPTDIVFSWK